MARIIQEISSAGFGGLEMVVQDFHAWLIENGHDALVLVQEGAPLHSSLIASGFSDSVISISKKTKTGTVRKMLHQELDSKDTAFLFHRHRALKALAWSGLKAKTSMISHTFYKSKKRDFWHRYLFSKVDCWIALTPLHQKNMNEMLGLASNLMTIIPNGVNLNKFRAPVILPEDKNEFHIGILARLDHQKGQEIAVRALALLKTKTQKKIYLHLFGDDTPGEVSIRPQLKALVEKSGLQSEVIFEGFKYEVQEILPQMDFLWLPSLRETFGRCVIEAMACGVAVVGSNAGGVPDIIEHKVNGMLFETMNAQDLMKQTLFLIEEPEARKNIREKALKDVRAHYDMNEVFTRLLHAILPDHVQSQKFSFETRKKTGLQVPHLFKNEASFEKG